MKTGVRPAVILESAGHYHTPIIQCLEDNQFLYILVNPIISYQAKKTSLRKVKQMRLMHIIFMFCITRKNLSLIRKED